MTTVPVMSRLFFYCVAAAAIAGGAMAPKVHALSTDVAEAGSSALWQGAANGATKAL